MKERGFALVELIVVLVIMGVLLSIVALNFNSWQRKNKIEAQVKEMLSDLTSARMMAIQTKKEHRVFLNPSLITFRRYSTEFDVGGTEVFRKPVSLPLERISGGAWTAVSNNIISINERGYTNSLMTIAVGRSMGDAAYNCLTVNWARVNMGKINGTTCEFK